MSVGRVLALSLLLGGCASYPDYAPPRTELVQHFKGRESRLLPEELAPVCNEVRTETCNAVWDAIIEIAGIYERRLYSLPEFQSLLASASHLAASRSGEACRAETTARQMWGTGDTDSLFLWINPTCSSCTAALEAIADLESRLGRDGITVEVGILPGDSVASLYAAVALDVIRKNYPAQYRTAVGAIAHALPGDAAAVEAALSGAFGAKWGKMSASFAESTVRLKARQGTYPFSQSLPIVVYRGRMLVRDNTAPPGFEPLRTDGVSLYAIVALIRILDATKDAHTYEVYCD